MASAFLATSAFAADDDAALTRTVSALDTQVFDAYNRCDMEKFSTFFAPDVEFYHDKGGVTKDRQTLVDTTRRNICHKLRRELVAGTLEIYPIKDYGAIEEGVHRFCELDTGKCDGIAKFLMIWQNKGGTWQLTRIVSYAHRPIPQ
ncbi:nuclear transport factor 2 family protein [Dyella sp. 7MK23]|uniref:Nuclear transport factor 2 family protein n=2 Tax=Dyella acidiphila TaxID=2775866 RepID=A0ABR9GAH7_9GAMM|nr:nuclear transport factor 2 family protein [Dyella acidiphila]